MQVFTTCDEVIAVYSHNEEFEDTKGAFRILISKKNRQHNGQKEKVQKDEQRS
jgi:hypothetical protein